MTIEEKLKEMIIDRFGSVFRFSEVVGLSNSTVATILLRGIHKASIDNVLKICKALGISADELAQDNIVPIRADRKQYNIDDLIALVKLDGFSIDGTALSDNESRLLLCALEIGAEAIRKGRE